MHVVLVCLHYGGIIYAVNAHIEVAISHSVSECQSDESAEFAIFGSIPLGYSGPLCHALSLSLSSLSWTSMRKWRATLPVATSGKWA